MNEKSDSRNKLKSSELKASVVTVGHRILESRPVSALKRLWYVLTQKREMVLIRRGDEVIAFQASQLDDNTQWRLSDSTAHYAIFSALVYHPVECNDTVPAGLYTSAILDEVLDTWQFVPTDELNLEAFAGHSASRRLRVAGLKYHFWYSESRNEFLIVFRGTSGALGDWWANFRWVTRFVPGVDDHYDTVRAGIVHLVDKIYQKYGETTCISVAGHSLGGGLAQQAAYAAPHIQHVYAFNSTPVTGFYEVEKSRRLENVKGLRIVRIFEHGEVLAFLRFFIRRFYKLSLVNPEIHEMRFNFLLRKNLISEHSMDEFSRVLYMRLTESGLNRQDPVLPLSVPVRNPSSGVSLNAPDKRSEDQTVQP